ncbi:hypothetical protein [Stutzerimonas kunmingensis]|uniref:hypothetical protein n=1 Tax=Stutzerimonas kunmingensis TaxID=1211807 RepID=UPI0028B0D03C|nr:hypothetical protein [Stutzerimonas kunmingensis]
MKDQTSEFITSNPADDTDWLLQHIAEMAGMGVQVPVTLTTAAGLVTGVTVSGSEYLDHLKQDITKHWPADMQSTYFGVVEEWKASVYPKPSADEGERSDHIPSYIHLKGARLYNAGTVVPGDNGMLWRGRLSSIIGFTVGVLTTSADGQVDEE